MGDNRAEKKPQSPSPKVMAFPNFDAEFVEGLDITAGGRPSQPTRQVSHYIRNGNFQPSYNNYSYNRTYESPRNPQVANEYQQAYPANGFAANYQSAPYGPSALNMSPPPLTYRYSTSFNTPITNIADPSDYFGYHQVAGQNFGVSPHEYQSELQKFRQTPSSWTPNPSTLSFVPLSPSAVLNLTRPSSLQGLRGAPPTAPRAMLVLGSSPRQLNLEDIHPRPTGRISQTRPDKSRKDIVITSAGVLRNVIELREMRAPAGQIYEEDTGAFGADKYNFAEHLEDMNESARMSFFDQNFIEIEIDVAAIEAEAEARGEVRLFDAAQNEENDFKDTEHTHGNLALEVEQQKTDKKAHETKSFGEQVEKGFAKLSVEDQGKKMAAGPSREKYDLAAQNTFKSTAENSEQASKNGVVTKQTALTNITQGKPESNHLKPSTSTSLTQSNNLFIPATSLFDAITILGPSFPKEATTLFITIKYPPHPTHPPSHFPVLPPTYTQPDIPSSPTGAIDTQSTPLFRHISALVDVLQSFTSLKRLDITLLNPANTPKPLTVAQLDHVLPFYDLESFMKWRLWWRAEYMSQPDQVNQWPIAHLNGEWGKICTWRDKVLEDEGY